MIDHRILHHFTGNHCACGRVQLQAGAGGEVGSGAVAGQYQAVIGWAEIPDVLRDPAGGVDTVVVRSGKGVFGCQAIVNRNHRAATSVAQYLTEGLVGIQVTDHPAATMEVDDQGFICALAIGIDPSMNRARSPRNLQCIVIRLNRMASPAPVADEMIVLAEYPDL